MGKKLVNFQALKEADPAWRLMTSRAAALFWTWPDSHLYQGFTSDGGVHVYWVCKWHQTERTSQVSSLG